MHNISISSVSLKLCFTSLCTVFIAVCAFSFFSSLRQNDIYNNTLHIVYTVETLKHRTYFSCINYQNQKAYFITITFPA